MPISTLFLHFAESFANQGLLREGGEACQTVAMTAFLGHHSSITSLTIPLYIGFEIVWGSLLFESLNPLILLGFSDILRRTVIGVSTEYLRFFDVPNDGLA